MLHSTVPYGLVDMDETTLLAYNSVHVYIFAMKANFYSIVEQWLPLIDHSWDL